MFNSNFLNFYQWLVIIIFWCFTPLIYADECLFGLQKMQEANYSAARNEFESLAKQNIPCAMLHIAENLHFLAITKFDVTTDNFATYAKKQQQERKWYTKALQRFTELAEQGDVKAQYHLGVLYVKGVSYGDGDVVISQDQEQATFYINKAFVGIKQLADQGDIWAQFTLAGKYVAYIKTDDINNDEQRNNLKKYYLQKFIASAEQNNGYWLIKLADLYQSQNAQLSIFLNMSQDQLRSKAVDLYKKAIQNGLIAGQYKLARLSKEEYEPYISAKERAKYLKQAAENGHMLAQYMLGNAYSRFHNSLLLNDEFPRNTNKAFSWYLKSARQGFMLAMWQVANMYARSRRKTKL